MTLQRPIRLGGFGLENSDLGDLAIDQPGAMPGATGGPGILDQIATGAQQYYKALSDVQAADLAAQLAKARGEAAIAAAKQGGAYQAARAGGAGGLPSPSLLLIGGLVLGTVFLLSRPNRTAVT